MDVMIAKAVDVPDGSARVVQAGPLSLALVRVKGTFFALENRCPHAGGPLGEGTVTSEGMLRCPWHERNFDPASGGCLDHPHTRSVQCFAVRVREDGGVYVTVP